ncbi:hypothetical protein LUZ60_007958 [Juncus effusus]|nr:hypothetical protein LUZ60_007958 [Juncus effusus]
MKRAGSMEMPIKKRVRRFTSGNPFDVLSDDLIVDISCKISATANSPSDLISLKLTCKRFEALVMDKFVLAKATGKSVWISPKSWSEPAHRFLTQCADAGNIEAIYFLGMIEFYCHSRHAIGASLLARAAESFHPEAMYSLAVIQFNGSGYLKGGPHCQHNPQNALRLCDLSASVCHPDSLREVGYCLWNGRDPSHCPRLAASYILKAEEVELQNSSGSPSGSPNHSDDGTIITNYGFYMENGRKVHPANRFLLEWWWLMDKDQNNREEDHGLKLCGHMFCGRRETRNCEFRRCSICGKTAYCSYACQEIDWKMEHRNMCNVQNLEEDVDDRLHRLA